MSTLITMAWIIGIIWSVWVALLPWHILCELKRQGAAREAEALKIISLLARIAGSVPDKAADEAARIQARIDAGAMRP